MKRLVLQQSNDEFYTSHSGLALVGACINRSSDLGRQVSRLSRTSGQIADIDIVRSYLGLLCLGKSDFQAVAGMHGDDYFQHALGIARLPTTERLRQRLDQAAAGGLIPPVFRSTQAMLKRLGVKVSGYANGLVPLDVDVFPQDNSNTKKEGTVTTPRPGKQVGLLVLEEPVQVNGVSYPCKRIVRVTERTINRHGQLLLSPEISLEGWWTDLDMEPEQILTLYRDHAISEQFHSEFKTDLDLERLPSGKFASNALVMALEAFAYNILRVIGQMGLLGRFAPIRHPAKRRRIRTVMQELIYLAGRLISTGRRLVLRMSRYCPGFAAFQDVYGQLVPAR